MFTPKKYLFSKIQLRKFLYLSEIIKTNRMNCNNESGCITIDLVNIVLFMVVLLG